MSRKPFAIANWKMTMTVIESVTFRRELPRLAGDLLNHLEVVIAPPFTALWPLARTLTDPRPFELAAQNIAITNEIAHTGQISAKLVVDAGCQWVMLGHWEVRRDLGDDNALVNRKVHLALETGLKPILLVGEGHEGDTSLEETLSQVLAGCQADQVAQMALVYEPEATIGVEAPASPEKVATGCGKIRAWVRQQWGDSVADQIRLIYGGSVTPEEANNLLASPEVDGLGASRSGRQVETFTHIIRQIVEAKAVA